MVGSRGRSKSKEVEKPKTESKRRASPSRGRNTSPSRKASPSRRSPQRRTSPSRRAKEKSSSVERRKSSRIKEGTPSKSSREQRIVASLTILDSDSDTELIEEVKKVAEKPKATVRARTRRIDIEEETSTTNANKTTEIDKIQRITRSQNREVERVSTVKQYETNKKLGEFSDEDEVPSKLLTYKSYPNEFGGWIGSLFLIISSTISIVALYMLCDEYQCSFTRLPNLSKYKSLKTYYDPLAILCYIGYFTSIAILSALPFGGRKVSGLPNKHGKLEYVMNGVFSAIVIFLSGFGLEWSGIPITNFIIEHIFHLLIASLIVGYLLSFYLYVRSFYVPVSALNTHVIGKNSIYAFFMGREVNPRIFGLIDMKMFVLRFAHIASIFISFAYLYKNLTSTIKPSKDDASVTFDINSLNFNPTLLVYVVLHTIYLFDPLIMEASWVTSFEVNQEGIGFMGAVGYSIYPFMTTSVVRYIVNYNVNLEPWKLALISIVFLVGYILFRGSNGQKDAFRKNPYNPQLSHLETIPTTSGKKLLVSGFWGVVRHPNYLGDIIMNLAIVPFVCCAPPVITIYSIVLLLVHRSIRDNARCKEKYGTAWDRYCNKVKYVLIPKVY